MRVLLDLNVVLDLVLKRQPWDVEAKQIWYAHLSGTIDGWMTATEFTNLHFIVRRLAGEETARAAVRVCLATFGVVPVDQSTLVAAVQQSGVDFEDNVCIVCAIVAGMDLIVTRDPAGFAASPVPAVTPAELIVRIAESHADPESQS